MMDAFSLIRPRLLSAINSLRPDNKKNSWIRVLMFAVLGIVFWIGIFVVFYRVLSYFQSVQEFGDILAMKLLAMVVMTFFALLIFSNIINCLSHLYLSQDLPFIHSLPVDAATVFFSRWLISTFDSSWMVVAFSLPAFLSYGLIYHAGPLYYAVVLLAIAFLCVIAAALSSAVVLLGAAILPAGRIRTILVMLGFFLVLLLVLALRLIRPEQLVNPDSFATVVLYLNSMQTADFAFLPTTWITDALRTALQGEIKNSLFHIALAGSFAFTMIFINDIIARVSYFQGFSRAQTTPQRLFKPFSYKGFSWESLFNLLPRAARAFAVKEVRTFFRDSTQWPQLFLMAALIAIYLYNFSVLPLDKSPIRTVYLQNLFSFLNMGLAAFVLAALAARFVFPAVSMEGRAFWIVQAAPVSLRTFLWIKFFLYCLPLTILAEILIIASNLLLSVTPFIMVLSAVTMFCLVPPVVALAIGLGASYPNFQSENPAQAVTSFGGLLFMLFCLGLIAAVIILEAGPVYYVFMSDIRGRTLTLWQMAWLVISFTLAFLLCLAATLYPMIIGERRLSIE